VVVLTDLTLGAWALFELGLRVREARHGKGRRAHDRGTRTLLAIAIGLAIAGAIAVSSSPQFSSAARIAGLLAMWVGLGIRVWAVAALGAAFRTTVEVDPGQHVVSTGPYRWVRHPSYTGLLLIVAGFGLARGTWLSVAIGLLLPLPALVRRIRVEEAELNRVLGDAYHAYQAATARLVPGLW
jgi:protein-S-isoprenylcysteine O-methyltransferase Ste14